VEHGGQLVMIYTGHCWTRCQNGYGVFLLAATSSDGRNWTKRPDPVMSKSDLPFTKDGAAEADIVKGPDNFYYLFMTLLQGDAPHEIGVARSTTPYGPWEINPSPILRGTANEFDAKGVVAPSVLIEGNKVRMWFHGFGAENTTIRIGYAEALWPLKWPRLSQQGK
jgi:beta-xylosidase